MEGERGDSRVGGMAEADCG